MFPTTATIRAAKWDHAAGGQQQPHTGKVISECYRTTHICRPLRFFCSLKPTVSHRIIQIKYWVLCHYVLSSSGLHLPPTCLLGTVNEARSYFASTIQYILKLKKRNCTNLIKKWSPASLCVVHAILSVVRNINQCAVI
jgi:hypothetical protein